MRARGATEKARAESTKAIKKVFLEAYEACGAIGPSAKKAGVDRDTILRWRKKDRQFDQAVTTAFDNNTDTLRLTAYTRAVQGTSKGADTLMIFLLKARDPEHYRERYDFHASGSFTLRDFMLFGERQTANESAGSGENLKQPGVVFDASAGNQPVVETTRNHPKPKKQ